MLGTFTLAAIVLAVDRLSKWWVVRTFDLGDSLPLIPGIFHLTYVRNTGAAFSLFPGGTVLLAVFSALVVTGILIFARRIHALGIGAELGLILGGGLGNLVDRVREGGVVDFLDFRVWPVFNLADTALVIGVLIVGYRLWRGQEPDAA
ncbi:MAG TPA: signal peptidase II [Bacillota bacterium]